MTNLERLTAALEQKRLRASDAKPPSVRSIEVGLRRVVRGTARPSGFDRVRLTARHQVEAARGRVDLEDR